MAQSPVVLPGGTSIYVVEYGVTVTALDACHAGACVNPCVRSVTAAKQSRLQRDFR
jgi:hypothetical protein